MRVATQGEFLHVATMLVGSRKRTTLGRAILIGITTIINRGTVVMYTTNRGQEDMAIIMWCVMHVVRTNFHMARLALFRD